MLRPPRFARIVSDNVGAEVVRRTSSRAQTVSLSLCLLKAPMPWHTCSLLVACDGSVDFHTHARQGTCRTEDQCCRVRVAATVHRYFRL